MTWDDMELVGPPKEDERVKALRAAVRRALDEEPLLERHLRTYMQAASYTGGRDFQQVAHAEGQRTLARQLLQLGGKFDE